MSSGGKTRVGRGWVLRRSLTDKCGQSCTRSRPSSVSLLDPSTSPPSLALAHSIDIMKTMKVLNTNVQGIIFLGGSQIKTNQFAGCRIEE